MNILKTAKGKTALLVGITAVLLLAGIGGSYWVLHGRSSGKIAVIYQDGQEVQRIDLEQVTEPYTITISGQHGEENVIFVEPGAISMESATCPDQLCVKQGTLRDGVLPIVCLPNHVRIALLESEDDNSFDVQVY